MVCCTRQSTTDSRYFELRARAVRRLAIQ
jgi:hypothetical protein